MKSVLMCRVVVRDPKETVLYRGPWTTKGIDIVEALLTRFVGCSAYIEHRYVVTEEDPKTPGQLLYEAHCRIEKELHIGSAGIPVPWVEQSPKWQQAYEQLAVWKDENQA